MERKRDQETIIRIIPREQGITLSQQRKRIVNRKMTRLQRKEIKRRIFLIMKRTFHHWVRITTTIKALANLKMHRKESKLKKK